MQTEKLVFNKLFKKEELKSENIELSSIKELESVLSDGKLFKAEIEKQGTILANKLGEAVKQRQIFDKAVYNLKSLAFNSGKNVINEFKNKAKDLGLDTANVQQIKDFDKLVLETKDYEKYNNSIPTIPQL